MTNTTQLAYTASQAAQACGLPRSTVELAIGQGHLPAMRSGRRHVILATDLTTWLMNCKRIGCIPTRTVTDSDRERLADLNKRRRAEVNP
jgi:excisionase family DNA binding protein